MSRQDRACAWCGVYETVSPMSTHHIYARSIRPDLIDDKRNLLVLCALCHQRTEDDMLYAELLKKMFYPDVQRFTKKDL